MTRGKIVTLLVIAGFVALLAWSTLSAQKTECEVCVEFNGRRNCATASAASEEEAARSAKSTACGPVASGMAQAIMCDDTPPVVKRCSVR